MICNANGQIEVPFPFTIMALVISVGLGLSHFMKGSGKDSRSQQGTAFFVSTLAFIDILLRLNWITMAIYSYQKDFQITFICLLAAMAISTGINLGLWRRFFNESYNLDEDPYFA